MYAFGPLTFLFLSCLFPTALMSDSFSSQPPDLMARLTGTISLVWGEKCNGNHEATTKVLCLYYEFIIKMCNGHNTVQEILVIHHLCIKTTYERTDSLLVSLKLISSRTGCENRVHFSWAELVMVSISATPCTSNSSRATWCCETTTVQIPTLTQNNTELCVRWQVWKMSCNFRHGQAVYSDLLPLLFLLHQWTRSKNLLSKRSV